MRRRLRTNFICTRKSVCKEMFLMIDKLALILSIVGGLNWGSIGIFKFDIVAWIGGGQGSLVSRIIYTLVGLSAVWCISLLFRETDSVAENDYSSGR